MLGSSRDVAKDASAWDRTRDLSVNSRALYQLSHGGNFTCEVTPWRNGSALDSKSKGWGFESLWGHFWKNGALGRIRTCAHIVDYDLNVAP